MRAAASCRSDCSTPRRFRRKRPRPCSSRSTRNGSCKSCLPKRAGEIDLATPNQDGENQQKRERRVTSPAVKNCDACLRYEAMGWVPAGTLPPIGKDCDCRGNCKCRFEYEDVAEQSAPAAGEPPPPPLPPAGEVAPPSPGEPSPSSTPSPPSIDAARAKLDAANAVLGGKNYPASVQAPMMQGGFFKDLTGKFDPPPPIIGSPEELATRPPNVRVPRVRPGYTPPPMPENVGI